MENDQSFEKLIDNLRKPLTIHELRSLTSTCTIIDTRIEAETTGLIKGSYWFPGETIHCNWLPTFVSRDQPYVCICDRSDLNDVLESFILMGYMNCKGYNNFEMKHYDGEMEFPICRNWHQLGDTERKQFVDVRTQFQWNKTGVPRKAMLIELTKLDRQSEEKLAMLKEIQKRKLIVVNCKSGQRTKLATSILFRHGIFNVSLVQNIDDFPKLGIKMQTVGENQQYWQTKRERLTEVSSEEQNKIQKQLQSDNMNRMAVEECYEECLRKHPQKSAQECRQECSNKKLTKNPDETIKLQHSSNRNQFQASKQHILPSKIKSTHLSSHDQSPDFQLFKKALNSFKCQNYVESAKELSSLIEKNPENAQLYVNRALCQFQIGDSQKTKEDLEKAIHIDQMNFMAYFNLASLKLNQSSDAQSKQAALQQLSKSLSCLYLQRYKKTKDQNDLQHALSLNSDNLEALMIKGFNLCEGKNLLDSLNYLQRVSNIMGSENQKILSLCNSLRQKIQASRTQQKEENPQVEKTGTQPVKTEQNYTQQNQIQSQGIDQKISNTMNEWNKLYSEIYGNPTSIMHETKGSNDVKNTIWILN